jgi:hypothetical protein
MSAAFLETWEMVWMSFDDKHLFAGIRLVRFLLELGDVEGFINHLEQSGTRKSLV